MQPNKHNFRICFVVLSEMNGKSFFKFAIKLYNNISAFFLSDLIIRNQMTPLMLKKHLTIAENIEKLTRLSMPELNNVRKDGLNSISCSIIRNISSITMKKLKVI